MTEVQTDLVQVLLNDRRSERRWKNIRFFVGLAVIFLIILMMCGRSEPEVTGPGKNDDYVALVRLDGMIGPDQGFSAETIVPILNDAFSDKEAKGVILDINSGGGTPVQASIIHDQILKLKKLYKKRVIVVGEDTLASGAYFVAVSGDKIYVNPNTVTGSIGVIMEGFGFNDAMKKFGVDRRVYTAGDNKDRLDPYLPINKNDVDKVQTVLAEVHANFNHAVMEGRKGKLHGDPKTLFSGDFWGGQTALKLGLVDALGNLSDAMEKEFNVTKVKDYSESKNPLHSFISQLGLWFNLPLSDNHVKFQAKL